MCSSFAPSLGCQGITFIVSVFLLEWLSLLTSFFWGGGGFSPLTWGLILLCYFYSLDHRTCFKLVLPIYWKYTSPNQTALVAFLCIPNLLFHLYLGALYFKITIFHNCWSPSQILLSSLIIVAVIPATSHVQAYTNNTSSVAN